MKVLVTGANGQLGWDVLQELARQNIPAIPAARPEHDVCDGAGMARLFQSEQPGAVIHCAAYTAVDRAEDEPGLCGQVNVEGTRIVAALCRAHGAKLLYLSTDYVFDGRKLGEYETDDAANPLSVYGKTKLAGEAAAQEAGRCFIVRTSWVFGNHGGNFVKTMLRLAAEGREPQVVCDQVGSPTYTADLAALLVRMIQTEQYGIYHATNEGHCSWAELAAAALEAAYPGVPVHPIPTEAYPAKATRPKNSRLSKSSLDAAGFPRLPHWEDALARFLEAEEQI